MSLDDFRHEYSKEISDLVAEAVKMVESGDQDPDYVRDTWLHETIDGHQYVIYTAQAGQVILVSKNANAIFEECGPVDFKDWADAFGRGAYYAMMRDVLDELPDLEEIDEEREEREEREAEEAEARGRAEAEAAEGPEEP